VEISKLMPQNAITVEGLAKQAGEHPRLTQVDPRGSSGALGYPPASRCRRELNAQGKTTCELTRLVADSTGLPACTVQHLLAKCP